MTQTQKLLPSVAKRKPTCIFKIARHLHVVEKLHRKLRTVLKKKTFSKTFDYLVVIKIYFLLSTVDFSSHRTR